MESNKLERKMKEWDPLIRAVVDLFKPFAEAAVHDTQEEKIVLIYNPITRRKVGDRSTNKELGLAIKPLPDYFPSHYKMNYDGRVLKCTSIPIKDSEGMLIGLLCFSVDASAAKGIFTVLSQFLGAEKEKPGADEGERFEEKAKALVEEFFKERGNTSKQLSRDEKKELIQYLHKKGIFNYKKAPFELSKWLKVSRASIYNYIKTEV